MSLDPVTSSASLGAHLLDRCRAEFVGLKRLADGAIAQCSDEELRHVPAPDANSIAVTMKHVTGNLLSRWTDFLTTDGEKPWRHRDQEFEDDARDRTALLRAWDDAWAVLFRTLEGLGPDDVLRTVTIRSEPHTVAQALLRQVSHYGYHVGQIVQGARLLLGTRWRSLSIPRGGSSAFNQAKGHAGDAAPPAPLPPSTTPQRPSQRPLPPEHAKFLERALPVLRADARLVGVAAGGSYAEGAMDEWSDLDLLIAVEPAAYEAIMADRKVIAARLGPLLEAFTGEHVNEPRLVICLYGPPLLHVDLKFVLPADLAKRVEDPVVLWERDGRFTAALAEGAAAYPKPDLAWIEARWWTWIHYVAVKIGRGELFEAHGCLAFFRERVLGPMALEAAGQRPQGVRKIERRVAAMVPALRATLGAFDARACLDGLRAAVALYRDLRHRLSSDRYAPRAVELAAAAFLDQVAARLR